MSKRANAGEMRTMIQIMQRVETINENGFPTEAYANIFVNADNVEGRNQWLELSLVQKVPAR